LSDNVTRKFNRKERKGRKENTRKARSRGTENN